MKSPSANDEAAPRHGNAAGGLCPGEQVPRRPECSSPCVGHRQLVKKFVLLAVSLVILIVASEVIVRFACPQRLEILRPDIWESAEGLGWRRRANLDTSVNSGEGPAHLYTDSRGFRVGSGARPVGKTRILMLGDSFMGALAVEYEESLAGLIESRLGDSPVGPVEVWNAAVSGYDPCRYLIQTESVLSDNKIDLVLVALYVGNDAVEEWQRSFTPRKPARADWTSRIHHVHSFLKRRSHLFTLTWNSVKQFLVRLDLRKTDIAPMCLRSEAASRRWEVTADICAEIRNTAALHDAGTLFFLIPSAWQVDTDLFRTLVRRAGLDPADWDLEQSDDLLRVAFEARGLATIDLLPTLRAGFAADNELYGDVDDHFNARGHAVVATALEPAILEALTNPAEHRVGDE